MAEHPFRKMNLEEDSQEPDTFTIRLNSDERIQLEADKKLIEQTKDSTALKQLARVGSIVLHSKKEAAILDVVLGNKRRNKRLGIADFD